MKKITSAVSLSIVVLLASACSSSGSDSDSDTTNGTTGSSTEGDAGESNTDTSGSGEGENTGGTTGTGSTDDGASDQGSTTSSSTAGSSASGDNTAFGNISATYSGLSDEADWSASFFSSETPFPISALEQEYISVPTDSCSLADTSIPGFDPDDFGDVDIDNLPFVPETVSAGEVITVTSPAGTYASLKEQSVFGFQIYQTDDGEPIAGPIPENLVLDIPGAAGGFPAFSDVSFPYAAPLEFTQSGSEITWTNSGEPGSSISIIMSAIPDGNLLQQLSIECDLIDDGSHQISADLLSADNVEFPLFSGERFITRVVQVGGSALILQASSDGFLNR